MTEQQKVDGQPNDSADMVGAIINELARVCRAAIPSSSLANLLPSHRMDIANAIAPLMKQESVAHRTPQPQKVVEDGQPVGITRRCPKCDAPNGWSADKSKYHGCLCSYLAMRDSERSNDLREKVAFYIATGGWDDRKKSIEDIQHGDYAKADAVLKYLAPYLKQEAAPEATQPVGRAARCAKAVMAVRDTLICIEKEDFSHIQKAETLIRAYESCYTKRESVTPQPQQVYSHLHAKIQKSLDYFRKEFPKDKYQDIWSAPVSYHCGGVSPDDLQEIADLLCMHGDKK